MAQTLPCFFGKDKSDENRLQPLAQATRADLEPGYFLGPVLVVMLLVLGVMINVTMVVGGGKDRAGKHH